MKKIYLFILVAFMLLLPVTSSFAIGPATHTGQQILVPYALSIDPWWSGAAVHNTSSSSMSFSFGAYRIKDDGTAEWKSGITFDVPAHSMKAGMVQEFFSGTPPTGRMSLLIQCSTDLAPTFQVTLFVGNLEGGGFGFQNYTSWDWVYTVPMTPGSPIFDPTLPIGIPKPWQIIPGLM